MNKLNTFLLVAFLCVLSPVKAQNSILWEITGNGLSSPSYLLGTLKFIGEREYFMPAEVKQHLLKCKLFAIEDQVDHKAQHELNKVLYLPKGQTINTLLGAEDYKKIIALFEKEFGISQADFNKRFSKLIPLALSITMTRLSLHEGIKYYDIELLKIAKKNKLDAYSLEAVDREAQALHAFPIEDQVKALVHSVNNFETQKSEYKNLETAFVLGDLDKVFEYTLHPLENNTNFITEFYTKRNQEWLPKLEKMIKEQPSFIAVGVAHLEGDQGLLAQLRARGFELSAVPIKR